MKQNDVKAAIKSIDFMLADRHGEDNSLLRKTIREALEKQLSKQVAEYEPNGNKIYFCSCGDNVSIDDDYCSQCGQALEWGDNSDGCVCCGDYVPEGRQVCPKCEGDGNNG